ncbi:MAG: SAM-dependent methyltransferase, partial [Firmicutes bacterium]|nr:SAM-dependent methyltransferase [Bacillota bacterium]
MAHSFAHVAASLARDLDEAGIAYVFSDSTALALHGVSVTPDAIEVRVQWDRFDAARELLDAAPAARTASSATSRAERSGVGILLSCRYNTVVAADPERVPVPVQGTMVWAESVTAYRRATTPDDPLLPAIERYLTEQQREHSHTNEVAWNQSTYDAWVQRYGAPAEAAARIVRDPAGRLAPLNAYLGDVAGKRVINLLGSHGSKAVALALLGADAAVVDISPGNAVYARELAAAAGVSLRYVVSDVLALPDAELTGDYDIVLLELGILHYFVDLRPLARVVRQLLRPGGRLILQD